MNGGTLFDILNEVNHMQVKEAVEYLRNVIDAVTYLHEQESIVHRDIKPENIVVSSEGVAKLCDFGWAAKTLTSRNTYCGTIEYVSPEIL
jgi:aurora kinase